MEQVILFLDDNEDLRNLVGLLVQEYLGIDCLSLPSLKDLDASDSAIRTRVAILDINLGTGDMNGLGAYDILMNRGYTGPIAFLTGHSKSHPLVIEAKRRGVTVLEKPIRTQQFIGFVREALELSEVQQNPGLI